MTSTYSVLHVHLSIQTLLPSYILEFTRTTKHASNAQQTSVSPLYWLFLSLMTFNTRQKQLKAGWVNLGAQVRVTSFMAGKSRQREREAAHHTVFQEAEGDEHWCSVHCLLFVQSRTLGPGTAPLPTVKADRSFPPPPLPEG